MGGGSQGVAIWCTCGGAGCAVSRCGLLAHVGDLVHVAPESLWLGVGCSCLCWEGALKVWVLVAVRSVGLWYILKPCPLMHWFSSCVGLVTGYMWEFPRKFTGRGNPPKLFAALPSCEVGSAIEPSLPHSFRVQIRDGWWISLQILQQESLNQVCRLSWKSVYVVFLCKQSPEGKMAKSNNPTARAESRKKPGSEGDNYAASVATLSTDCYHHLCLK